MTYKHTQTSPLYLILFVLAAIQGAGAVMLLGREPIVSTILGVAAALVALAALTFKDLTVEDLGEHLVVRFGPIPLFRRQIAYTDIARVEPARSNLFDGWGIHYRPGQGWIWNLWGFGCVKLVIGNRSFRVGTDDVEGLAGFLKSRLNQT